MSCKLWGEFYKWKMKSSFLRHCERSEAIQYKDDLFHFAHTATKKDAYKRTLLLKES